jgi:signal peptidase II
MSSRQLSRVIILVACLATIGCDRITKQAAATILADSPDQSYLADTVRLTYVENLGGFLSVGAGLSVEHRMLVFTVATGVLLLGLTVAAIRGRWEGLRLLGAALIVSGGASNWIDRVVTGSVIDFLNVGIGSLRTGIFNAADVGILVGAGLMGYAVYREPRGRAGGENGIRSQS